MAKDGRNTRGRKKKQVSAIEKNSWQKKNAHGRNKKGHKKKKERKNRIAAKENSAPHGEKQNLDTLTTLSDALKLNSRQKKYKKECINRYFVGFENFMALAVTKSDYNLS